MGREVELVFDILEGEENPGLGCETPSHTGNVPVSCLLDFT